MKMKKLLIALVFLTVVTMSGCGGCSWRTPDEGTVEFKTMQGRYERTIRPSDGAPWENWWGDEYHTQHVTSVTKEFPIKSQTSDNARVTIVVAVTYKRLSTNEDDPKWIAFFGLDEKESLPKFDGKLDNIMNKYGGGLTSKYTAYDLNENKAAMQSALENGVTNEKGEVVQEGLKTVFPKELISQLELVQIKGAPDFENDDIESAASKVVANQKLKEAAQAALEADKIEQQRKQLQAQTYENKTLYEIRLRELQVEEAKAWASHQGPLYLMGAGKSPVTTIPIQ